MKQGIPNLQDQITSHSHVIVNCIKEELHLKLKTDMKRAKVTKESDGIFL